MFINQMRLCENLKVDKLVAQAQTFPSILLILCSCRLHLEIVTSPNFYKPNFLALKSSLKFDIADGPQKEAST